MAFRGPLSNRYGAAVALVVLALTPYLMLTTALQPLQELIGGDLGLGATALSVTSGMANAAYAFGAVGGLQLAVHLPVRRLLIVLSLVFVAGSVLAAWSPNAGFFVAGRVLQGLTTGGMLIAAVPPLVLSFGPEHLPRTAVVMNFGIFGAVALGPVLGGAAAGTGTWHPFLWIVAGLGLIGTLFAVLTFEDQPPQAPDAPWDIVGVGLTAAGVAALFFGVSYVSGHHLISVPVLLPALGGLALLVAGLTYEYRARDPLMPIKQLGHTLPFAGIVIACAAGGASVAFIQVASTGLGLSGASPYHAGTLFWPLLGGALLAAIAFGALFTTRWTPAFALTGLLALAGGGVLVLGALDGDDARVLVGTGLIGLGTGASVAPALFTAGFSLRSSQLPRVFAMVELLRGVAAFLIGPLLLHLAQTTGGSERVGLRTATWIGIGIALGGFVLATTIYRLGGARRHPPRIEAWMAQEGPALDSPPILDRLRGVERELVAGRAGRLGPAVALVAIAGVGVVLGLAGLDVLTRATTVAIVLVAAGGVILISALLSLLGATGRVGGGLATFALGWIATGVLLLVLAPAAREPTLAVVELVTAGGLVTLAPSRRGLLLGLTLLFGAAWFTLAGLALLLGGGGLDVAGAVVAFVLAAVAATTAAVTAREGAPRPVVAVAEHAADHNGRAYAPERIPARAG